MSIRVLEEQGPIGIKQEIASLTADQDQWYWFNVDLVACQNNLKPETVIRSLQENLQTYDGVVAFNGQSLDALLKLGREQEIFQNLMLRLCPEGFSFGKISSDRLEGGVESLSFRISSNGAPAAEPPENDNGAERSASYTKRMERNENRAIIIDDDAYIRTVFSATLKKDFRMTEMSDGTNIEQFYKDIQPDIVFVDIHLPELDGFGILKKIIEMDPDAYVIVISGDSIQSNVIKAVKMGAKGFLTKPPKRSSLDEYLRKCPTAKLPEMAPA